MPVTRGRQHDFLGLNLTFGEDKTLEVGMKEYFEKEIEEFGETLTTVNTPAKSVLLQVDENSPKVKECERKRFHSIVMLIMCVALR